MMLLRSMNGERTIKILWLAEALTNTRSYDCMMLVGGLLRRVHVVFLTDSNAFLSWIVTDKYVFILLLLNCFANFIEYRYFNR
ncbi:hypothetical protein ACP70R_018267 [Stipagrostis hirtigluma subsp. patula]